MSDIKGVITDAITEALDGHGYGGTLTEAVIAAIEKSGHAIVPLAPTLAMVRAGMDNNPTVFTKAEPGFARDVANDVYVSMVRAALQPKPDGE